MPLKQLLKALTHQPSQLNRDTPCTFPRSPAVGTPTLILRASSLTREMQEQLSSQQAATCHPQGPSETSMRGCLSQAEGQYWHLARRARDAAHLTTRNCPAQMQWHQSTTPQSKTEPWESPALQTDTPFLRTSQIRKRKSGQHSKSVTPSKKLKYGKRSKRRKGEGLKRRNNRHGKRKNP